MEVPKDIDKEETNMKGCIIVGPATALGYHTLFPLFADKVIKVGHKGHKERIGFIFNTEQGDNFLTAYWYTTLEVKDFDREFTLTKTYDPEKYPHYDNYPDIIEVRRCDDIPIDYTGIMGVPTSFFRYHPELDYEVLELNDKCHLNGKQMFKRLFIRRKQLQ